MTRGAGGGFRDYFGHIHSALGMALANEEEKFEIGLNAPIAKHFTE